MTQFLQRDSPIPRFFAYPKFLLTLDLSETAKIIYVLLLDRARLSMKKEDWQDEHGRVFIATRFSPWLKRFVRAK